jgi:peptidyl-tRNA hydrolase, PTH1 family
MNENMKLIVGLGNPGEQYESTRHNLGFMVLEKFLKDFATVQNSNWLSNEKLKSEIVLIDWQPKEGKGERVILARPKTYMNNSGMAVQLIASFYKVEPEDIWIINDDLDLPLGKLKIRFGGAAAGHHGVEDIIEKLGTDKFWRFRLGIGNPRHTINRHDGDGESKMIGRRNMGDTSSFVLGELEGKEKVEAKHAIKDAVEAINVALENGMESAMNRFNTK